MEKIQEMKATQRDVAVECRGKTRQIYMKPDIEKRALVYCQRENASMSLLIRIALDEFLKKRGL